MKIAMVSAFTGDMADYGLRMYRSFRRFNPDVPMFFADWHDCPRLPELVTTGVQVLRADFAVIPAKHPRFRDMLLWPFVKALEWDALVWIDADTMILRPLTSLWTGTVDFAGHPDRDNNGMVLRTGWNGAKFCCVPGNDWAKFASGVWMTRNRALLLDCYRRTMAGHHRGRDSDVLTAVVNECGYSYHQLDGNLWNFGRQLIDLARYDGKRISYTLDGKTYEPYTAGFSRVPVNGVDVRLTSDALDEFYREQVGEL